MIIDLDDWAKLPAQDRVYYDDKTETLMFSAGLGCISPAEILPSTNGSLPVSRQMAGFCLSIFEGEVVWALNTDPFPKGEGGLFRVTHERGEFVAYGSHLLFSESGSWKTVLSLRSAGRPSDSEAPAAEYESLYWSNLESCQSAPFLSARRWMRKPQDSQDGYPAYIRFYGEQLLEAIGNALDASPLLSGAHKSALSRLLSLTASPDDWWGPGQERIHQDLQSFPPSSLDYIRLRVALEAAEEYLDFFAKLPERILPLRQAFQRSLDFLERHPTGRELSPAFRPSCDRKHPSACSTSNASTISSVSPEGQGAYWDLHVFGSNNYYLGGAFHHNSGKTHCLVRKALKLSAINRHVAGGILAPTYSDYKKDIEPEMEMVLKEKLGMVEGKHYRYNRSEKTWRFCWSKAPIYIFTAERPIAGPNLGWGCVNEFSMVPYARLSEFMRRVRVKDVPVRQKLLVGTPEDLYAYLEEFVAAQQALNDRRPDSFRLIHASTTENTYIDENYADHLRSMLDTRSLEVFLSGQIVRMHGNYFYYAFSTEKCIDAAVEYDETRDVHASLDFNVGRMTTTLWQKDGHLNTYCFDEIVLSGDSDTPAMSRALSARYDPKKIILHIDASAKSRKTSGRSDLQMLKDAGFVHIRFKSTNPTFRDRQLLVNGKMDRGEIKIHPKCKALIKDCKSVRQEKSDFSKDKKVAELTHASDTMDYYLDYEYPLTIQRKTSTIQL